MKQNRLQNLLFKKSHFFKQKKDLESLINQMVQQIQDQSKNLTQVLPPKKEKVSNYQELLDSIANLRGRPLLYPYISSGLGQGPFVQLLDGSVKLDFICGIGPHILGHSHPKILRASLKGALEDAVMLGHLQTSSIYQKLLNKLLKIASKKSNLAQAWFSPSGSMANENALKSIRQKHKGARKIIAFEKAFAGRTTLMSEITANPNIKEGLPVYNEVLRVPFSIENPSLALKTLKSHWEKEKGNISCFIMELMQGDGGCFLANKDFFIPLLDFCKSKKIAIWFDEVQTFGRSGQFFAFEKLGLGDYVDVCTIGKAFQLSATLWTKEYNPQPGLVSGTFAGSSSSFHSSLVVLNELEGLIENKHIEKVGATWQRHLKNLEKENLLSNIQGWGLMWGATPVKNKTKEVSALLGRLFQKGLICYSCGQGDIKRLRFLIPATLTQKHLNQAASILKSALLESLELKS
ncbi:MAG: aminotransferase class III-fold pyridoxal phosphate-dependent enzyme [Bdellovibrionales bacterium]|nr:aminotransferase class III-fold pyridoxal phosphate-dependent enzyme [Bdellovibrionales bacterium]